MHRYLNTTHRTVLWFKRAMERQELEIKPPFQRNPVWSRRQQSALIDTILLEYPIPELYMQDLTDADGKERHIVVDGQQRIRAVLDYLAGEFELEDESPKWPGIAFDDLGSEDRKRLYEYNFVIRVLPDIPEEELRVIFSRINRSTETLNAQELRHATYWGPFIKLMEQLSNLEFWNDAGIFSANDRRRMLDVEFISELAVAYLNGLQNKKKNLEEYYQVYEVAFDDAEKVNTTFVKVLGEIQQVLPDFSKTRWRKKSDFYSLFLAFAAHESSLPLDAGHRDIAREGLAKFATDVDAQVRGEAAATPRPEVVDYVKNVERAASDLATRTARDQIIKALLAPAFS